MSPTIRNLTRGTLAAAIVLSVAGLVVSGPLAAVASPPMLYPIARLLPYEVTQAARGATFAALEMQGYEMTEPITIASE